MQSKTISVIEAMAVEDDTRPLFKRFLDWVRKPGPNKRRLKKLIDENKEKRNELSARLDELNEQLQRHENGNNHL